MRSRGEHGHPAPTHPLLGRPALLHQCKVGQARRARMVQTGCACTCRRPGRRCQSHLRQSCMTACSAAAWQATCACQAPARRCVPALRPCARSAPRLARCTSQCPQSCSGAATASRGRVSAARRAQALPLLQRPREMAACQLRARTRAQAPAQLRSGLRRRQVCSSRCRGC
jgi:hypothetical protein